MEEKTKSEKPKKPYIRGNKRTPEQKERDKQNAIYGWSRGLSPREIHELVMRDITLRGDTYTLSESMVRYDIRQVMEERKKEAAKGTTSYVEQIITKFEHLYKEALDTHEVKPAPGYIQSAMLALEKIAKLRGVWVDKQELDIKGGLNLSKEEIEREIDALKKINK